MAGHPSVALIFLDSAERTVVERGMREGWLPHLARFRQRGQWGVLNEGGQQLELAPWVTFLTGKNTGDHGSWNYLAWDPQEMNHVNCDPAAHEFEPWWRTIDQDNKRAVVLDIPRTYAPVKPFDGVELGCWAAHYRLADPYANPSSFLRWVSTNFDKLALPGEPGSSLEAPRLLAELDTVRRVTKLQADLAVKTLQRESCDLFMMALSGPHRIGHLIWDEHGMAHPPNDQQRPRIDNAIRDTYIAADEALGRMLDELEKHEDTTIMVAALQGMGQNTSLAELLPEMLDRILNDRFEDETKPMATKRLDESPGLLQKLRKMVPLRWRSSIKEMLPTPVQLWLTRFWRKPQVDWANTQAITLMPDNQGYIRINLQGREKCGIVQPGKAYDELCAKIIKGLRTFVHADTGEPAVIEVKRTVKMYPDGERKDELADLVVYWSDRPAYQCAGLRSEQFGFIPWPTPGRMPDARSGHHRPEGWLALAGPGIDAGGAINNAQANDLPPTICSLLDIDVPQWMTGRPIEIDATSSITSR